MWTEGTRWNSRRCGGSTAVWYCEKESVMAVMVRVLIDRGDEVEPSAGADRVNSRQSISATQLYYLDNHIKAEHLNCPGSSYRLNIRIRYKNYMCD